MTNKVHFFACFLLANSLCASAQFVPELGNAITSMQYTVTETEAYYIDSIIDPAEIHDFDWIDMNSKSHTKVVTSWLDETGFERKHIHIIDSDGMYEDWMNPPVYLVFDKEFIKTYSANGDELASFEQDTVVYQNISDYSTEYQSFFIGTFTNSQIASLQSNGVTVQNYTDHYKISQSNNEVWVYPNDKVIIKRQYDSTGTNIHSQMFKYMTLSSGETVMETSSSRQLDTLSNGQIAIRINNHYYSDYFFNISSGKVGGNHSECKLYPNPTSNELFIESEQKILDLDFMNMHGSLIEVEELYLGNRKAKFHVANLVPGVYFIRVRYSDGNSSVLKFIKQ
jgi:hypothetical protein